jgi:hypothetical protein
MGAVMHGVEGFQSLEVKRVQFGHGQYIGFGQGFSWSFKGKCVYRIGALSGPIYG